MIASIHLDGSMSPFHNRCKLEKDVAVADAIRVLEQNLKQSQPVTNLLEGKLAKTMAINSLRANVIMFVHIKFYFIKGHNTVLVGRLHSEESRLRE
jgi:hypothetical protein